MPAVGWALTAVLGFFALMRLVAWDATEPFAVVNSLTTFVYLPAWIVAAASAIGRRWLLGAAAALIVAVQLFYLSPELLAARPVPSWASHAPRIRLFDANVDKSKQFRFGYASAIEQYRPDVVTLEEFTPGSLRQLVKSRALMAFPYRCLDPRYGATGFLLASRLPMTGCKLHTVPWKGHATPYMVSATVQTRGGPLQLRVVHTLAPFPSSWPEWGAALRAIDRGVSSGPRRAMLMVGDLNATWNNRRFCTLLSHGLTDAAAALGEAFDMTWPNGAIVPPFVRIDHVLTGNRLVVTKLELYSGYGSDHRFLTATVAIHSKETPPGPGKSSRGRVGTAHDETSLVGVGRVNDVAMPPGPVQPPHMDLQRP